ncbi:hypothetical protein CLAFUW4_02084 [Fulvia fulva]|uniref:Uncharacterized protein n=1 Tax=Passalora fulva TaxID=5499 RepID=A0A9Q8P2U4_PASFU|nr:uncharacterized protein CLAFUR5_02077 [Fulvia fulva]KAK4635319.1 hypothetical protein CLAFUR4_02080 [Fulvia fulva]KAK4638072.1 hypothetical protein CLAFUR0_02083 [Fulvia fulva]UJO11114.1 hypothetical protein CLAFUR5_02077 [Fulvia fulva]WPV08522.1 hypothetical protein CLAFUW4_02084 [Fulvia fulva]WPV24092.1 hypothetical protein CLAFUW7_02084 [Fulvia fulva]
MALQTLLFLVATLALVSGSQDLTNPAPTCTSTITHRPAGCCPPRAGHTALSYTDCHGCDLEVITRGPQCLCAPTPVKPMTTTTKPCTSVVTELTRPCGDCGMGSVDVTTALNCKGCALSTTTVAAGGVGICACPTAPGMRGVFVCKAEATLS